MRKIFIILAAMLFVVSVFSQAPQMLSYQAIIRNSNNALVTNKQVGLQISLLQGSASGTVVYTETQTPTTNANGLISIEIGSGIGFSSISWANGIYFIKTETDPSGGSNYTITGTNQLLSVPYAMYAQKAGNGFSGNYNDLTNKPVNTTNITPRNAVRGQVLSVSFSGGDNITFSQASPSCPNLYADVILKFDQGSPTQGSSTQGSSTQGSSTQGSSTIILYPLDKYFIDSNRFDAVFDIPSYIPSGLYDIILSPSSSCSYTINSSFKIY